MILSIENGICKRHQVNPNPEKIIPPIMNVKWKYNVESIKMLIIYGGEAERKRSLDTFDILMISEWRWSKLLLKMSPTPR